MIESNIFLGHVHKRTPSFFLEGGDPSAGSPTDTLLQLSPPRETWNRHPSKRNASSRSHSAGLMGSVCKAQGRIHRAIMTRDYWGFQAFTRVSYNPRSELRTGLGIGFAFRRCDLLSRPLYAACSPGDSGHTDLPLPTPSSVLLLQSP